MTSKKPTTSATNLEKTISFNVRALLTLEGLKQSDLARHLNVDRSTISLKLAGKTSWSVRDLEQVSEYLNVTPVSLLDGSLQRSFARVYQPIHQTASENSTESTVLPSSSDSRYFVMPDSLDDASGNGEKAGPAADCESGQEAESEGKDSSMEEK